MYLSAIVLSSAIIHGAKASLEAVPPTSQCFTNQAVGKLWSCDSGFAGCQFDGAKVSQDECFSGVKDDVNVGHEFCIDERSTLILDPPNGGKQYAWGGKCSDLTDNYGDPYVWGYEQYNWKCCTCPTGFVGAGIYEPRIDGFGSYTYNTTKTGGTREKTCMRCTGAGEVLTYNPQMYSWSCVGGSTHTTHKPTKTTDTTKKPTHTTKTSGGGGGGHTTKTTKKTTKTPTPTHHTTKKHTTKKHTTKKHHTTRAALRPRVTQF